MISSLLSLPLAAQAPAPTEDTAYQPKPYVQLTHPEWVKDAVLYQINTRQFTPEGTFRAAERELPRLKELGVTILWLMPVNPIGVKNRKGTLGSPYAVEDYLKVNPEFGTLDDLKHFLSAAHALGFHVILDWVANHTAWDNHLVTEHPDWYARNWKGDFMPTPWFDWDDIIDLDYSKPALRKYMTEALLYWVRQGFDGFRCDVAGFVPLDFWEEARRQMDRIKPVFLLGEWQSRDLMARSFDAVYGWTWYDDMKAITTGGAKDLGGLYGYYAWNEKFYPHDGITMTFVSNHDKNAWEGTEFEAFGPGLHAAMVLSVVGEGLPLVYNGQEAGYNHRLAFFERDPIVWKPAPEGELYRQLFALKKAHSALWNAHWGAHMIPVANSAPAHVLSFVRQNEKDKVLAVINFSAEPQTVSFKDALPAGSYTEYFSGEVTAVTDKTTVALPPWGYKVFVR
ncbi:MAG: alpha-amylase family glycosyl hydrolase [Terracidiphilus sp.]